MYDWTTLLTRSCNNTNGIKLSPEMRVRPFDQSDWTEWRRMRFALWPHRPATEHEGMMTAWLARSDAAVFLTERPDGSVCGFVEVGSRPYADGCRTTPVGYIEGWYVDPDVRQQGYGRALLRAAEAWACGAGYQEMASDALLDNTVSHRAHERNGYREVNRVVQFRKPLT